VIKESVIFAAEKMDLDKDMLLAIFVLIQTFKQNYLLEQETLYRKILLLYALYEILRSEGKEKQRQFWVRPIFTVHRRFLQGDSENLVKEMELDETKFRNYFRMDLITLKKIIGINWSINY